MRIAICDDNRHQSGEIESQLLSYAKSETIEVEIFDSGDELIAYLEKNKNAFHIYFLDIEMPGRNGIITANQIRKNDLKAIIIFITQHRDYVYEVFEALPFRFLMKPIDQKTLVKICSAAIQHIKQTKQFLFFKKERKEMQIPYDEIEYLESVKRQIFLHTQNGIVEFYEKLSNVEKNLDETLFVRVGISYIINMSCISEINGTDIILQSGTLLTISKRYKKEIKEKYLFYIKWRNGGDDDADYDY